jgi:nitrite reductase/ring-hydroxylating ferredoxin subunit
MNKREVPMPRDDSDFVRKEAYYQPEFVALEKERLWSRVWQVACREEELPEVGSYVVYDIYDESIIVTRAQDKSIRAFHNVCQHRGRRLMEGCGKEKRFRCKFHGWQYELDGKNSHVTQREDWGGILETKDINLKKVNVDTWGGYVFINMNPDAEPLMQFLEVVPEALDPFQLEKMRYVWRKWLIMPCNWKVALESFNEGYHVDITHNQLRQFGVDHFLSEKHGKHGMFGSSNQTGTLGLNAAKEEVADIRGSMGAYNKYIKGALGSLTTDTLVDVSARLETELPKGTPPDKVIEKMTIMAMEADAARGAPWPNINTEQYMRAGIDWHVFPNLVMLPMATNCLGYRSRPNGDDPNTCIFEVFHLERVPDSELDSHKQVENKRNDDIYDYDFWGEILLQDFQQMQATHRGMKSTGFTGPRTNPLQETAITNFHREYWDYLNRPVSVVNR